MPVFHTSRPPFAAGGSRSRLRPFPSLATVGALTGEPDGLNLKSSMVDSDDEVDRPPALNAVEAFEAIQNLLEGGSDAISFARHATSEGVPAGSTGETSNTC